MKALSVRQPWASAIIRLGKDVENRLWRTPYRGPLLIHAGKARNNRREENSALQSVAEYAGVDVDWTKFFRELRFGGIIGRARLADCVHIESKRARDKGYSSSPWACGRYLWVLKDLEPLEFVSVAGQLNIFNVPVKELLQGEVRRVEKILSAYAESGSCATATHAEIKDAMLRASRAATEEELERSWEELRGISL